MNFSREEENMIKTIKNRFKGEEIEDIYDIRKCMLQNLFKDITHKSINSYDGFNLRKNNEFYIFTMSGKYDWETYIGAGKTTRAAILNIKNVCNAYNKKYSKICDKINNYPEVIFTYKLNEIVYIRQNITFLDDTYWKKDFYCNINEYKKYIEHRNYDINIIEQFINGR